MFGQDCIKKFQAEKGIYRNPSLQKYSKKKWMEGINIDIYIQNHGHYNDIGSERYICYIISE